MLTAGVHNKHKQKLNKFSKKNIALNYVKINQTLITHTEKYQILIK